MPRCCLMGKSWIKKRTHLQKDLQIDSMCFNVIQCDSMRFNGIVNYRFWTRAYINRGLRIDFHRRAIRHRIDETGVRIIMKFTFKMGFFIGRFSLRKINSCLILHSDKMTVNKTNLFQMCIACIRDSLSGCDGRYFLFGITQPTSD